MNVYSFSLYELFDLNTLMEEVLMTIYVKQNFTQDF